MIDSAFKDTTQPELLVYLWIQFVPHSKHTSSLLQNHYVNAIHRKIPLSVWLVILAGKKIFVWVRWV
jgi:hypothetical protein